MNSAKLFQAIYAGDQETAFGVLKENESYPWLNMINRNGQSLLYCAARYGCVDILQYLVGLGGEVNRKEGREESTPLHGACWGGHMNCVKYLISQGSNPFISNAMKETPLDNARHNKFTEIAEYLISVIEQQSATSKSDSTGEVFESVYEFEKRFDYTKMQTKRVVKVPDIHLSANATKIVTIVSVSDTHVHYNDLKNMKIPDADIFIHAGDFSNMGTPEEYAHFNAYLGTLPHKHKIIVAGNHDFRLDSFTTDYIQKNIFPNCTAFLVDSFVIAEGIKIYGSPWTGIGGSYHVNHDSSEMAEKFNKIPKDVDILVTHNPPFNVLDKAWVNMVTPNDGVCMFCLNKHPSYQHWGSKCLLQRILEVKPKVHCFGHVHDEAGIAMLNDCSTTFVNNAIAMRPTPVVFFVYV